MDLILAIDKDVEVHEKAVAKWAPYGISIERVETIQEAIAQLKQKDDYLFVAINEDTNPDFMSMLPILRDVTDTPIFIMSSTFTTEKQVKAMSLGADTYDHYHTETNHNVLLGLELLKAQNRQKQVNNNLSVLVEGDIILSESRRSVFVRDSKVSLTKKEFDILYYLMCNKGRIVTHVQLLQKVWGEEYNESDTTVLWRTVNRLRSKLSNVKGAKNYIKVERGIGYKFLS